MIAGQYHISFEKLNNLITSESQWNPKAYNAKSHDRGLVQINKEAWPTVSDEQAYNAQFAMNFAAKAISEGKESAWVVCSCWSAVKTKISNLPRMKDILPGGQVKVGGVAIFIYPSGLKHIAYIESISEEGFTVFEANYEPCKLGKRFVKWEDKSLIGFMNI